MHNQTLEDRMRVALADLIRAQPLLVSAITELNQQGYTTPASDLAVVLADLIAKTEEAKIAVS